MWLYDVQGGDWTVWRQQDPTSPLSLSFVTRQSDALLWWTIRHSLPGAPENVTRSLDPIFVSPLLSLGHSHVTDCVDDSDGSDSVS